MIDKPRKKSQKILALEAAQRRAPLNFPKKLQLERDLSIALAGYRGEEALNYHLTFLQKERYHILHELRLEDEQKRFFQIDSLLLSQYFYLILEVKNYSGLIQIQKDPNQLIKTQNEITEYFQDPLIQVRRQILQLKMYLRKLKFPLAPILYLVVFTNPNAILDIDPHYHEAKKTVVHAEALPFKVAELENHYKNQILNQKDLKKLSRTLIKDHQQLKVTPLETYDLREKDLIRGVYCPTCFQLKLLRELGMWYCPQCETRSKNAHILSLKDYYLLISPTITNEKLRSFLELPSRSIATNILKALKLPQTGQRKNRQYDLASLFK